MRKKLVTLVVIIGLLVVASGCGKPSNIESFSGTMTDFQLSERISKNYFIEITDTEGSIMSFVVSPEVLDYNQTFTVGTTLQINYYSSNQQLWKDQLWYSVKNLEVLEE